MNSEVAVSSQKVKRSHAEVLRAAAGIMALIEPGCERLEVAGSLRRQKAQVGDIEIVAVPVMQRDLFGEVTEQSAIDTLLSTLPVQVLKNGQKYKQFLFEYESQVHQVDL